MFREMRRIKQRTDTAGCEKLLREAKRGVLSVLGDGGYPYGVPMDFVYADGKIYFHSAAEGHKIDALKRCDKVSFCVMNEGEKEPGEWWYRFSSVIVFGRLRIVTDEARRLDGFRKLGEKYFPEQRMIEEEIGKYGKKALLLELTIEHMSGKTVREK
ncbi:MAG: pyridoxamine 5'-phosphate oxidase family protein [Clostridia bacterium]|nr:pyridoxamine 5'-phosphate oxidase family protein [Clostridia bacterium]